MIRRHVSRNFFLLAVFYPSWMCAGTHINIHSTHVHMP